MPFMPFSVLGVFLRGLLSLVLFGAGIGLLTLGYQTPPTQEVERRVVTPEGERVEVVEQPPRVLGLDRRTLLLAGAAAVGLWALGGWAWLPFVRRGGGAGPGKVRPASVQRLRQPDGAELYVETYGPADAPALVFTHGWGLNADEWRYAEAALAGRYRVVVWDLPGLGRSRGPDDRDWSLERMATHLRAVVEAAGPGPVVLVGHSIGGMITLTYCRLFAGELESRVCGLVIAHSTYTNPVETNARAWLYRPLQKPVLEPLCHLMVWTAPLLWLTNLLSYLNGSAHDSTERASFSGREDGGQLGFLTRTWVPAWPAVIARGMLGMFRYDATATLPTIPVPVLAVAADDDQLCLPSASERIARDVPRGTLVTLRRARHAGLFEHHAEFCREVERFAESCVERAAVRV